MRACHSWLCTETSRRGWTIDPGESSLSSDTGVDCSRPSPIPKISSRLSKP